MLALYIIFGAYFALCLVCGILVGLWSDTDKASEDNGERKGHTDRDS